MSSDDTKPWEDFQQPSQGSNQMSSERLGSTTTTPDEAPWADFQGDSFGITQETPQQDHPKETTTRSMGQEFLTGLKAGAGQVEALVKDAAPALFFDVIGNEEKAKKEFQEYNQRIDKINEMFPSTFQNAEGFQKFGLMSARFLGEGLLSLGTSLAAGGVGLLAGGVMGAGALALGTSYVLNTPETYVNLIENEADNPEYWSLGVGALKTGLDFLPLGNLYRKTFGKGANDVITSKFLSKAGFKEASEIVGKQAAEQFVLEGVTEAGQEAADIAAEEILGKFPEGFFTKENMYRIALAGYAGALTGGVAGGGAGIVKYSKAERRIPKEDLESLVAEHQSNLQELLDEVPEEELFQNRLVKTQEDAENILIDFNIPPEEIPTGLRIEFADAYLKNVMDFPKIPNVDGHLKMLAAAMPSETSPMITNDVLESLMSDVDLEDYAKALSGQEVARYQKMSDTRNKGVFYHGTSTPIVELAENIHDVGSEVNFYGPGFYTTDAQEVSWKYSKKGKGKERSVYQIEEKYPMSFYDMETPIEGTQLYDYLDSLAEYDEVIDMALSDMADYNQRPNLRNFYDALRDASDETDTPAYETQDRMADIANWLTEQGYDGLSHTGGLLTKTTPHTVKIYFDPKNQIDLKDISKETAQKYSDPVATSSTNNPAWDITQGNLRGIRLKSTDVTPRIKQQMGTIMNAVKIVGGDKVKVEFTKDLFQYNPENDTLVNPVRGAQLGNTIYIALQFTDPTITELGNLETALHEVWHQLYDSRMGLFTDKDRQIIESQYPQIESYLSKHYGTLPADIKALYSTPEGKSEVIATLFGKYAVAKGAERNQIPQMLRPFFNKVISLIKALGRGLRGQGFGTFENIFDRTLEGSMAPQQAIRQSINDVQVARLQKISESMGDYLRKTVETQDFEALLEDMLDKDYVRSQKEGYWGLKDQLQHGLGYFLTATMKAHNNKYFALVDSIRMREETDQLQHLNEMQRRGEKYFRSKPEIQEKAGEILRHLSNTDQEFTINERGELEYMRGDRLTKVQNPEMIEVLQSLRDTYSYVLEQIEGQFKKHLSKHVDGGGRLAPGTIRNKINEELKPLLEKEKGVTQQDRDRIKELEDAKGLVKNLEALRKMRQKVYFPDTRFGKYAVVVRRQEDITPTGRSKPDTDPVYFAMIPEGKYLGKYDKEAYEKVMGEVQQYKNDPETYEVSDEPFVPDRAKYFDILSSSLSSLDAMVNLLGSSEHAQDYRDAVEAISDKIKNSGFNRRFLEKKRIPGASDDFIRVTDSYVKSASHYLAKQNHAGQYSLLMNKVEKLKGTERGDALAEDVEKYVNYIRDPNQEFKNLTTFNFFMTMGFNLSTSALQYMTLPTYTLGAISQFNPNVLQNMKTLGRATKDIHSRLSDKNVWTVKDGMFLIKLDSPEFLNDSNFTEDEKNFFKWFYNSVHSGDLFIEEMTGTTKVDKRSLSRQLSGTWDIIKNSSGVPISVAEQMTRATSALAIYRTLRDNPSSASLANSMLGVNAPNPDQKWIALRKTSQNPLILDLTGFLVDDAHAVFGKRGRGRAYRGLGRIILPFMQYPMAMNEFMIRMAKRGPEGRRALAVTLGSLFFFAGALGLPAAEALKELLEQIIKAATGENIDVEREFRILMADITKTSSIGTAITQGVPRAFGGIDIGGRLRQPIPGQDVLFALTGVRGDTSNLLGVQGSYMSNAIAGINEWKSGGTLPAVGAMLSPTALANLFKAVQYMDEGVRTRKGVQLLTPEEVKEHPIRNVFLRALGIGSADVASAREEQYWANLVNQQYDPKLNQLRSRAANATLRISEAYEKNDKGKIQKYQKEYQDVMDELSKFVQNNNIPYNVRSFNRSVIDKVKQRLEGGPLPESYDKIRRDQYQINKIITGRDDYFYNYGY